LEGGSEVTTLLVKKCPTIPPPAFPNFNGISSFPRIQMFNLSQVKGQHHKNIDVF
jgi:hypothetical protein